MVIVWRALKLPGGMWQIVISPDGGGVAITPT